MVIPPNNNISKGSTGAPTSQSSGVASRSPAGGQSESKAANSSDAVSLSPEARKLANLESAVSSHSGVDEAKVAAIKSAIDSGQYRVDSHSLSQKMLDADNQF